MLKVKGVVRLERKTLDGKLLEVIEKENVFTKFGLRNALSLSNVVPTYSRTAASVSGVSTSNLVISTQTTTPTEGNEVVNGLVGDAIWDFANPLPRIVWEEATDTLPMYGEMRVRLDAQGVTRSFQTIAVIERSIQNFYTGVSAWQNSSGGRVGQNGMTFGYAHSYLLLDSPVVQGGLEIIDIFYRLYFIPSNGQGIDQGGHLVRQIGRSLFGLSTANQWNNGTGVATMVNFDNPEDFNQVPGIGGRDSTNSIWNTRTFFPSSSCTYDFNNAVYNCTYTGGNNDLGFITGMNIKSLVIEPLVDSSRSVTGRNFVDPNRSKLQTSWAKRENATPFFNANDFAIGGGRIEATENWTGYYPEFFRIVMDTSGDLSSAEYHFERMRFTSFVGNSWVQVAHLSPQLNGAFPYYQGEIMNGSYGTDQRTRFIKHNDRQVIFYNERGITLMDVMDSSIYRNLGADTAVVNPLDKLDVESINQVTSDGTFIYVACSETGLWVIDTTKDLGQAGYVSNPYTGECYGVTEVNYQGSQDIVIATDVGITTKSQAYATFSNPTSTRITTHGWNSIKWIEGNTADGFTDGEIVLLSEASAGDRQILWWDRTSSVITEGFNSVVSGTVTSDFTHLSGVPSTIRCSPLNGWWAISFEQTTSNSFSYARTTYGSNTYTNTGRISFGGSWIYDVNQNFIMEFDEQDRAIPYMVSAVSTFSGNNITVSTYFFTETTSTSGTMSIDSSSNERTAANLNNSSGIPVNYYSPERLLLLDRDEDLWTFYGYIYYHKYQNWISYGWDGSNWVRGDNTPKQVHSTSEPLIQGIEVLFTDEGELNPFFATDFYTLPVCDGILGDNAKIIQMTNTIFGSNYRFQVEFPTGASQITVPNVSPYQVVVPGASEGGFLEMDTNSSKSIRIVLDGVEVDFGNILDDGSTPPSSGFVSVDKPTGILTFHPSDINKPISGYYSYSLSL